MGWRCFVSKSAGWNLTAKSPPSTDLYGDMGKDKKTKQAEKKARVAEKANKKATQKEKKGKTKGRHDESDVEDIDLDAVLEEYARQQAQFLKVTEAVSDPPSPRSSSTLTGSPSNSNELFLFGGELFDGAVAKFYNDLYIYLVDKDEWRAVTSPNTPLPRSGHAWCRGGNDGGIYLFGGEFSSPKQGTFYHYNDFWRLDPSSREWTRLESKAKGPPARSGHRMTYYKNYILLYGGFQDTSQQTKYLSDLWIYDCLNYVWHNPVLPPHSQQPDARSSFSFLPHESGAVIFGGYSRVKSTVMGKQTRGGGQSQRTVLKPMVHQDTWFLRVTQLTSSTSSSCAPAIRWERRKRPANAPNPPRAGTTMAFHRGRGILFGGVYDVEESEEGIDSEFFDALFAWGTERNRFFQLTLRPPRVQNKKQQTSDRTGGRRDRGKANEDELLRNLAALEAGECLASAHSISLTKVSDDAEPPAKPTKEKIIAMPHPRFNAQLAVQDDVLYIYGGTFEKGDREFTFDEMWAIDLDKLDGVREIFRREPGNWEGSEDGESDDEDEDEDEDDRDEEDDKEDGPNLESEEPLAVISTDTPRKARRKGKTMETPTLATLNIPTAESPEPINITETTEPDPSLPHPRPFEALREFYSRTSTQWLSLLSKTTTKEHRTEAFRLAEETWWECREEIRALEDEQEDAGIGEVVGIAERGGGESGGRRR
ncbi:MAG: hypothetical protein M1840_000800 [Geoglossum simile]|nr:MAG: hypothetical protein M1840_000800 [Geoglossum simile]